MQEGQPCPVCGSLYHPFTASDEKQTLHEEELEKVRQEIAEQIALLQSQLERRQMEIARLDSLIGNYQKHEKQTKEKVQVYLGALTDWEALLEKGTLQQQIRKLADRWLKYTNEHIQQNERLGHLRVTVKLEENNLLDLQETLKTKETKYQAVRIELEKLQQNRSCLLKGKAVEWVEKSVQERKRALEAELKDCTQKLS